MILTSRAAHFENAEMARLSAGALKHCLDLAQAVLRAISAAAVGNSWQLPGELNSLRHLRRRCVDSAVVFPVAEVEDESDRNSTRLNSSHMSISYAVFCLK